MRKIHKTKILFVFGFVTSVLAGCGGYLTTPEVTRAPTTVVTTTSQSVQSTSTPTSITNITPRPTLTLRPSQSWYFTAVAIQSTENVLQQQTQSAKETQIAQFPINCDDMDFYSSTVSPNGEWFAASCGYKRDQTLIVQNRVGTEWELKFKDFLSSESPDGIPGSLIPKFWSPDGEYLYFTTVLGYSGGGNDCFPGFGEIGLFRLNLKAGSWTTLIAPTFSFPGYEIEFAPTGRRYAVDVNGVTITDLTTGEINMINAPGITEFIWSPDGTQLAYSVASCGEQFVQSSSVYVWDALTQQTLMLITMDDGTLLSPVSWGDNATLRIEGEKYNSVNGRTRLTIYIYDIAQDNLAFTGTATRSP